MQLTVKIDVYYLNIILLEITASHTFKCHGANSILTYSLITVASVLKRQHWVQVLAPGELKLLQNYN